jgi:hypothetical protein
MTKFNYDQIIMFHVWYLVIVNLLAIYLCALFDYDVAHRASEQDKDEIHVPNILLDFGCQSIIFMHHGVSITEAP